MGKHKSKLYKWHLSTNGKGKKSAKMSTDVGSSAALPIESKENVFGGIDIIALMGKDSVTSRLDDTLSVKSHVSNKSIRGDKAIPKKEKLKLRRQRFLNKIDTINQLKKEQRRKKKGKFQIIGDTKPMLESLPTLDSLLSSNTKGKNTQTSTSRVKKAIEKSRRNQKNTIQNIDVYEKLLKNDKLMKNPFESVRNHLKAVIENEKKSAKKLIVNK